jgi:glycosyltransferase involved in cell wall biosynthesis
MDHHATSLRIEPVLRHHAVPDNADRQRRWTLEPQIAVLIPCFNEASGIAKVILDFRRALPTAAIYVFDNNSTDGTARIAQLAGAFVRCEYRQGKGNVVRRMFSDIDADVYVLVDGDGTYHAPSAPAMVQRLCDEGLDMVVGSRESVAQEAYRSGHRFGNAMLTGFVARLFGRQFTDILSGYRVFSRRFVRSFPALSSGFEIETEITVHALELRMPIAEISTPYGARAEGSQSKLNTYRDGFRVLRTIGALYRREYPARFFGAVAATLVLLSVILIEPVVVTYLHTGNVPRFPTAILCVGLMLSAGLSMTCGLILDTVTHGRREIKRLIYLSAGSNTLPIYNIASDRA